MIIRLIKYQFRIEFKILEKRVGICSKKYGLDDKHMLLWDFDNTNISLLLVTLSKLQVKYELPDIYVIQSSPDKYHAYCFCARTLKEVIHILSDTQDIDMEYLRLGMIRGYYTLRITPRKYDNFELMKILSLGIKDEMKHDEMTVNQYFTLNKGGI